MRVHFGSNKLLTYLLTYLFNSSGATNHFTSATTYICAHFVHLYFILLIPSICQGISQFQWHKIVKSICVDTLTRNTMTLFFFSKMATIIGHIFIFRQFRTCNFKSNQIKSKSFRQRISVKYRFRGVYITRVDNVGQHIFKIYYNNININITIT